ncbi:MAG: NUDIX domain-containing protein [Candidatus Saccharimonadales bacterium]
MQYVKVAAHGIIKKGDKFLVTKRSLSDKYMPGLWDIPGGTIEFQEQIIDALNREIIEGTGLVVKVGKVLYVYDFVSDPQRHQFQIVYECEYQDGEVVLNADHDECRWVSWQEAKVLDKIRFFEGLVDYLNKS